MPTLAKPSIVVKLREKQEPKPTTSQYPLNVKLVQQEEMDSPLQEEIEDDYDDTQTIRLDSYRRPKHIDPEGISIELAPNRTTEDLWPVQTHKYRARINYLRKSNTSSAQSSTSSQGTSSSFPQTTISISSTSPSPSRPVVFATTTVASPPQTPSPMPMQDTNPVVVVMQTVVDSRNTMMPQATGRYVLQSNSADAMDSGLARFTMPFLFIFFIVNALFL
ncbi:uncharacterized protein VTP21DRAFT_10392 [Calcarisporiella thermophila]|uniref:uncharacterized protein n=1 Tax=Calcarisporiella thermophila TaxID=911321 RepID=UPI0037420DAF